MGLLFSYMYPGAYDFELGTPRSDPDIPLGKLTPRREEDEYRRRRKEILEAQDSYSF
jgi:hypothetical protein